SVPTGWARRGPVRWLVAPGGGPVRRSTSFWTVAAGSGGLPGLRVLSRSSPSTPCSINRACQRHTTGLALPDRRMISAVPQPSAGARMIWARHTCFCGAQRSAAIALRRRRSTGGTLTTLPAPMTRAWTASGDLGIARRNQTTSGLSDVSTATIQGDERLSQASRKPGPVETCYFKGSCASNRGLTHAAGTFLLAARFSQRRSNHERGTEY